MRGARVSRNKQRASRKNAAKGRQARVVRKSATKGGY